jgi:hypothetical protein
MAIKTYDPNELSIVIGNRAINGFAEDSAVTIEFEDAQYGLTTDIHGSPTRFRLNKNVAKITLNLTQSSSSNDALSSFVELDRVNNAGVFTIMVKDNSGTTLFASPECYIDQIPSVEFGNDNKNRSWTIIAIRPTKFIGGVK